MPWPPCRAACPPHRRVVKRAPRPRRWRPGGRRRADRFDRMNDQDFLPPSRPARKPGQEPSARLTLDAYVRLRKELEELRTEGRTRIAERLLRAREHGDIRENADYDAAKDEQGLMEARIRDLEHKLKDPDIIE